MTGSHETRLVVVRGPSGAGKSTIARALRERMGRGTALVEQDYLRRTLVWEKDLPGAVTIGLIDTVVRHALDAGYDVVLEGILTASRYGDMLRALGADHAGTTVFGFLDVSFEETVRRHATRPQSARFTAVDMAAWWAPDDRLGVEEEIVVGHESSADQTVDDIFRAVGGARSRSVTGRPNGYTGPGPVSNEEAGTTMATNPVYGSNFPDPAVLEVGGTYWAYATKNQVEAMPVLRSPDLVRWEAVGDGMPDLAPWVEPGLNWAPEIAVVGERYVAYYTAHDRATDVQAVGVAVADSPQGPFRDDSERPLLCQDHEGGSIDASPFTDDDGARWLLWKNDGNHVGVDTWIYVQRLSDDGLRLEGEPVRILQQDQEWEGELVEGPYIWPHSGRYYLIYSGNGFASDRYAVGYAVADQITGPYVKPQDTPIMVSNEVAAGPGHGMVVERGGRTWYVHHAWPPGAVGSPVGRQMWLTELTFEPSPDGGPDRPVLHGPRTEVELT